MDVSFTVDWSLRLDEYSNIFPYTVQVRDKLSKRQLIINHFVQEITEGVEESIKETSAEQFFKFPPEEDMDNIESVRKALTEFQDLLIDLSRLLQNKSLGRLFGNTHSVPERPDSNRPRMIADKQGNFKIIEGYDPKTYNQPEGYRSAPR